jgi:guanylate kinase
MAVISGPSGSGKSTICKRLLEDPRVVFSISATTRKRREGEVDGRDYHFLAREEFKRRVENGDFIEHAEVYGNMYGTLRAPMESALVEGKVYLLEIDVQGANQLRALGVPGTYIFIAPPDFEELRRRLAARTSLPRSNRRPSSSPSPAEPRSTCSMSSALRSSPARYPRSHSSRCR